MATPNLVNRGYSADVRMALAVNGHVFTIAQLGPDFLILRGGVNHPPADGEITFSIDGRERRWRVSLPDGIVAGDVKIRIACCS